jgi:hypothetical protein
MFCAKMEDHYCEFRQGTRQSYLKYLKLRGLATKRPRQHWLAFSRGTYGVPPSWGHRRLVV